MLTIYRWPELVIMCRISPRTDDRKYNMAIVTAIRNPSCSQGWLRLLVQIFFGIIIVLSFALILVMSLKTKPGRNDKEAGRCKITSCRVICYETPYYGEFEEEIIDAVWQNNAICPNIILSLIRPSFINNTLPENWLSTIRSNVNELAIINGNLQHIPPRAFNSQFSSKLMTLILEKINISSWGPETFVGLARLEKLYIKDCTFKRVSKNALQGVDDTLEMLDIKAGSECNPSNITGSADLQALRKVDFSLNPFYSVLDKFSFSQLHVCKILYLNSCRITYLGPETFDPLVSIKKIYLNDNNLIVLPDGFFNKIIPGAPRIALHDNLWYCNCSFHEIRNLSSKGLIILDPLCRRPKNLNGKTFTEFNDYCDNLNDPDYRLQEVDNVEVTQCNENTETQSFQINGVCYNSTCTVHRIHSKAYSGGCPLKKLDVQRMTRRIMENKRKMLRDDWLSLTFSMRSNRLAMVELSSRNRTPEQGLLWFQSSCPRDVYCINVVPDVLRIFDERYSVEYMFCPFNLRSFGIKVKSCISYSLKDIDVSIVHGDSSFMIIGFTVLSMVCLICGAICVYALIHRNPNLLKGNKRILFVKHKEINALVLPPKVPLRRSFNDSPEENFEKDIFIVSTQQQHGSSVGRSDSFTNSDSNEVSYISALEPTDEQLAEWRKKQTDVKSHYKPLTLDLYNFSNTLNNESLPYYSLNEKINVTPLNGKK